MEIYIVIRDEERILTIDIDKYNLKSAYQICHLANKIEGCIDAFVRLQNGEIPKTRVFTPKDIEFSWKDFEI